MGRLGASSIKISSICRAKRQGWPANRPEPHAWGTSHGSFHDDICRDGSHKNAIPAAIAEGGRRGEVRFIGEIPDRPEAVAKMVARRAAKHGKPAFCYEAGPCGYGPYRQITLLEHECGVVAPSLVPARPGDRVKTDRRDVVTQASLFRSGELTPVWVPDDAREAMRGLCRARQAAMEGLRRARQQALSFLLRHKGRYSAGGHWTRKHRLWLSARRFGHPARQIAFELVQAADEARARRDRLAKQMQELCLHGRWPRP